MSKVFIGVGHGGSDPGAVANGFREKDLNLSIALACNEALVRHGVITLMSRTSDENDSLNEEIRECNAFSPDFAVDIHNNAGGGDGAEAFYHYGGGTGKTLAENVLTEIVKIGQNSRGAKTRKGSDGRDYYGFIRETKAPAVIIECAFVDNATDLQMIDTAEEQARMGVAIAKGILATLGVSWIEPTVTERVPAVEPIPEETEPEVKEDPIPEEEVTEVKESEQIPEEKETEEEKEEVFTEIKEEPLKTETILERFRVFLKELIQAFFRWLDT